MDVGTPILKLDLQSTETEYKKLLDEEQMKRYQLEQLKVNNNTYLSDLSMQVKISAMKLNRMEVELRNERYLDSLGSGTTDKVRQAELNFNTGKLELEQLRQQYANESKVKEADLKVKELEFNIFSKSLAEMKRTLDDAQIRSPRKAILTYINNQVGAQVAEGSQVAIISDLSHFKVEGEIADTYGDRVAAGGRAIVKIGNEKLEGTVSSVNVFTKESLLDQLTGSALVISTVRPHRVLDMPLVLISPFLTNSDIMALNRKVEEINTQARRENFRRSLSAILTPELFETGSHCTTREEIVHHMCSRLLALGCTTPAFEAAVMERESISSTAFGQFAIPHTLKMCSPRTCMAVYVSRTPIRWDDTAVSLVIMLSFNPNDRKIFYDIFEPLSMILLDSNNLKGALLCKDYAAFIDFLVEHME